MTYYSRLLLSAAVFLGCSPAVRAVTPEEGRRIYLEAKEGNAESQYRLGLCFLKGRRRQAQSLPGQILVFQGGQAGAPHGGTLLRLIPKRLRCPWTPPPTAPPGRRRGWNV